MLFSLDSKNDLKNKASKNIKDFNPKDQKIHSAKKAIETAFKDVKWSGWHTDTNGGLLYTLAKKCRGDGVIVEIGSWKGRSTSWLGLGSKAGENVPSMPLTRIREILTKLNCIKDAAKNISGPTKNFLIISKE